jgi:hypothetical protein
MWYNLAAGKIFGRGVEYRGEKDQLGVALGRGRCGAGVRFHLRQGGRIPSEPVVVGVVAVIDWGEILGVIQEATAWVAGQLGLKTGTVLLITVALLVLLRWKGKI